MKADASALVGQVFNGMYRITRPLGVGGMGAVYEAVHTRLANKRFAVKMLHAAIAQDPEVFARFRREAEIATELGHPNIVEVSDFNVTPEGAPYMVMELLDGEDLAKRLQVRGPMTLDAMARIIVEVCSGLEAAHGAGIVHRDLKPQNIFLCKKLGRDDFVKIVDFGISKVKDSSSLVTRDHALMGTPFYMSPEQADGLVQQIDHRTDIFALGAIMWEMLTGRMAFEAPTISGAMYKVVHVDPAEVHTLRPDVPPAVSQVLRRAMAKQKDWRYPNVTELANEFLHACRGYNPAMAVQGPVSGHAATMAPAGFTPPPVTPAPGLGTPPPRLGTPIPGNVPPPLSQPGGQVRSQDAFAATGFVTPPPGALGAAPPLSQPPMPLSQPGVPQVGPTQAHPHQHVPATALPAQLQQAGMQAGMSGGLAATPGQMGVVGSGPPSTLTGATGQVVGGGMVAAGATAAVPQKKGKGGLYAVIGVVAAGGIAAAVVLGMGGGSKSGGASGGGDGDKTIASGGPALTDKPGGGDGKPTGDKQPIETPPLPAAPDAGVAVDVKKVEKVEAPPPVVESKEVVITFTITWDKGKAPAKPAPRVQVAGKPATLTDGKVTLPRGKDKVKIEVGHSGYSTASVIVVPDQDQTLPVTLKKREGGSNGPSIGWVP